MQHDMNTRLIFVLAACGLSFSVLPVRAQFASTQLADIEASTSYAPKEVPAYKVVHGVVQDKNGALPGATVWLHGSRTIAVANADGEFELQVPANAKIVELTCGYGGLEDEVIRLAPVQALGSLYLLRDRHKPAR